MRCFKRLLGKTVCLPVFSAAILLLFSYNAHAQNKTVSGKVVIGVNNEPVIGATISVKGSSLATTTKVDGTFSLEVPAKAMLEISAVGYTTQQVRANFTGTITILMELDNKQMGEVVVVGYGTAKKKTLSCRSTAKTVRSAAPITALPWILRKPSAASAHKPPSR